MSTRRGPAVLFAWAAFASAVAIAALALVLTALSSQALADPSTAVALAWLAYSTVGVVISTRRPGDRIGALLLAMGLSAEVLMLGDVLLGVLGGAAFVTIGADDPVLTWVLPLLLNLWAVAFNLLAVLLLVFPTGRALSPRWRPFIWLAFVLIPIGMVTATTNRDDPRIAAISTFPLPDVLFGSEAAAAIRAAGQEIFGMSQLLLFVIAAASVIVRYRRASGVERQQLKWLAYAAMLFATVFVGTAVIFFSPLRVLDPDAPIPPAVFGGIPFILALAAIPVAVGVAILRYRLYDIDVLINRTLVYAALSAALALVYVGSVLALTALLRPLAGTSDLAVAASTLAVVALFGPLRARIQRAVDRRFYRSRYDAQRVVDQFAGRLRDEVDLDALTAELLAAVRETVRPARAGVWVRGARR